MRRISQTASIRRRDAPSIAAKCEFGANLPGGGHRWTFFATALGPCSVFEGHTLFIDETSWHEASADARNLARVRLRFERTRGQKR